MAHYNPGALFIVTQVFKPNGVHDGVDYAAPEGTMIPAASSGTVAFSGFNATGGYGNVVIIRSDGSNNKPYYNLYAHMRSEPLARVGMPILQSELVCLVSNPGLVTGPTGVHLHFEVLDHDAPVRIGAAGGQIGFGGGRYRVDPEQFAAWSMMGALPGLPWGAGPRVPDLIAGAVYDR